MEPLSLAQSKKEWSYIYILLILLLFFAYSFEYAKYQDMTQSEVYHDRFVVKNIYEKEDFTVLKLQNKSVTLFTSYIKEHNLSKNDTVDIFFTTTHISFYEYFKGFYTHIFGLEKLPIQSIQSKQIEFLKSQHSNENITSIFQALFLALPLDKSLQQFNSGFGISHLFAISGFHLGIIVGFFYFIFNFFINLFIKTISLLETKDLIF